MHLRAKAPLKYIYKILPAVVLTGVRIIFLNQAP